MNRNAVGRAPWPGRAASSPACPTHPQQPSEAFQVTDEQGLLASRQEQLCALLECSCPLRGVAHCPCSVDEGDQAALLRGRHARHGHGQRLWHFAAGTQTPDAAPFGTSRAQAWQAVAAPGEALVRGRACNLAAACPRVGQTLARRRSKVSWGPAGCGWAWPCWRPLLLWSPLSLGSASATMLSSCSTSWLQVRARPAVLASEHRCLHCSRPPCSQGIF